MALYKSRRWIDPQKDQARHFIRGEKWEDQDTDQLDSAWRWRDNPMDDVTDGVGNGRFLPDSYSQKVAADRNLTSGLQGDYFASGVKPMDMAFGSDCYPGDPQTEYGPIVPGQPKVKG